MAFAQLARKRGVEIYDYTEVTGIEVEHSRVHGVNTPAGSIATNTVVNAAGSWGRNIAKMVGVDIPIFPQRLQAMATEKLPPLARRVIQGVRDISEEEAVSNPEKATGFAFEYAGEHTEDNLPQLPVEETVFTYLIPTLSGTTVIGTTNEFVGFDKQTTVRGINAILNNAERLCPRLRKTNIIRTWANFVPFTYDGLPIVGRIDGVEGFIMAAGHAHAVSHAPKLAEQLTDLIVNGVNDEMLEQVSIKRLAAAKEGPS
jgi:sarcosine oxidase subunit beta